MKKNNRLEEILAILPQRIAGVVRNALQGEVSAVNEIRLRLNRPASLSFDNRNVLLPLRVTESELKGVLLALCQGSPYAYADTIEKGYIPQKNGVRCGVCPIKGTKGAIESVSSVALRIPCECEPEIDAKMLCFKDGAIIPTLLYSPPGVGKTTVLRALIKKLCTGNDAVRGAVIDTRRELSTTLTTVDTLTDFLYGYEKGEGIELSVRTLSPQVIFCDEIGSREDADAILASTNTGVPIIASAHANSLESLFSRTQIAKLRDNSVFLRYVGIKRSENEYKFDIADM